LSLTPLDYIISAWPPSSADSERSTSAAHLIDIILLISTIDIQRPNGNKLLL